MIDDLKIIRKKYGEKMYHFCRETFPILLEEPGKLSKLLMDNFHESHSLYDDIEEAKKLGDFKNYIYSLVDVENNNEIVEIRTPEELMSEAGYDLVECYSEEDIQSYKKYYAPGEELCTFNGGRLNSCRVFFAVKKNVSDIKREDFKNPMRQDEYGTSVISIQFQKDGTNTLSIKNRYNHMVNNPDATFSSNLDNIISGLTNSFEKHKGIIQRYKNNRFEIRNYVRANDGKFYKYNYEIDNVYYCPDNIIIDNFEVKKYDKSRYLIIDYFIIDMFKDNKSISLYDKIIGDSFCNVIKEIKKIEIDNIDDGKKIKILGINDEYLEILIDKDDKMISLKMDNVCNVENNFLCYNGLLQELIAPNLTTVGNGFLYDNKSLCKLELSNLQEVGDNFLCNNRALQELNVPNLVVVGDSFLYANYFIQELNLQNLQKVGDKFLYWNDSLQKLNVSNLVVVGDSFLYTNHFIQELNLQNLQKVGDNFLCCNKFLRKLYALNLTTVGDDFLCWNGYLQELSLPNLTTVGDNFLCCNKSLQELSLLKLTTVGDSFLSCNETLQELSLQNLQKIGDNFLHYNNSLQELSLPNLQEVGDDFLHFNDFLQELYVPNLTTVGDNFLFFNEELRSKILSEVMMRNEDGERRSR